MGLLYPNLMFVVGTVTCDGFQTVNLLYALIMNV